MPATMKPATTYHVGVTLLGVYFIHMGAGTTLWTASRSLHASSFDLVDEDEAKLRARFPQASAGVTEWSPPAGHG